MINFQPGDTRGPNLVLTSHTDEETVTGSPVTIPGTASDAGRGDNGISAVYLQGRIEGATAAGGEQVKWSRVVELTPGRNYLSIDAEDNSPFPSQTAQTLILILKPSDSLPPALQITSHTDGQIVFEDSLTLRGTASDAGRGDHGIAGVRVNFVRADNDTATGAGVANWSRSFALNPGKNTIYVSAQDNSPFPQETNLTISVTYQIGDLTPPNLTIEQPRNQITVNTASIVVSGTVSDSGNGGSGVTGVTVNGVVAIGGVANQSELAKWTRTVPLVRGANIISVVAKDGSLNQNSAAQTLTVTYEPLEVDPPLLEITSHKNNQIVTSSSITLAGTATDSGHGSSGIASVTINGTRANGDTATGGGTAIWTRVINLNLGANIISVVARDGNDNATPLTLTITHDPIDTLPPDLVVTSHRKEQTVSKSTLVIAGTASDALQGAHGIADVTVNSLPATGGSAVGGATAQWTRSVELKVGPNIISVVAHDDSPNRNAATQTLTITYEPLGQTPPDLVVTSHRNGQTVPGATITLSGTATDLDRGDNGISSVSVNNLAAAQGTASFGGTNLSSRGSADIFVAKYDSSGQLLWARQAGGTNADAGLGIAVDSQGNCFVTGYFSNAAEFDGQTLKTTGSYDVFLAKYDSAGKLSWATTTGTSVAAFGRGVALDSLGNSYLTGGFQYQAQFGDTVFPNNEFTDIFVAKYGPNGKLIWANQLGGDQDDLGTSIGVDLQGSCYVTGNFSGNAFFGDDQLTSVGDIDLFVARFDTDGKQNWLTQAGDAGKTRATSLSVDPQGNCFVTGYFDQSVTFGANLLEKAHFYDLFLVKYAPDGMVLWASNTKTSNAISAGGVATDAMGNAYLTGSFYGGAEFAILTLTNGSTAQIFVAKYDRDGNFVWANQAGGPLDDVGFGVAATASGGWVITGTTTGLAHFGSKILSGGTKPDLVLVGRSGQVAEHPINLSVHLLTPEALQLRFVSDHCTSYRFQGSVDLRQWYTLSTAESLGDSVTHEEALSGSVPYQFFRVVSP